MFIFLCVLTLRIAALIRALVYFLHLNISGDDSKRTMVYKNYIYKVDIRVRNKIVT